MIRRKPSLISIASEESVSFLILSTDGSLNTVANLSLAAVMEDSKKVGDLPKTALKLANRMLVVPDYWLGNRFDEFQARKKSVITAFIERKLKLEQPELTDAGDFYNYSIIRGHDQRQQLYTIYLQEPVAYRLYRRLETIGINPLCITTPALLWQAKLTELVDGFSRQGVGFIHLGETDCFLYLFYMGQFLFSRNIQLPDTGDDASQIYDLLNYEINQSFYLYSQKTKSAVDTLFILAPDPGAADQLTDLMGREVNELPDLPFATGIPDDAMVLPPCEAFTASDLRTTVEPSISYKPLKNELAWRPVQWAGIAVGLILAALLALESGYLHMLSASVERKMIQLTSTASTSPDMVLQDVSSALEEIARTLARPSGSDAVMQTLLAMPEGVSMRKIAFDVSQPAHLNLEAVVDADNPESFKALLKVFLHQLNHRLNPTSPLREKDVSIHLDRSEGSEKRSVYRIDFGFEI